MLLAASATRNSSNIATALPRSCVVSKLTYLCRTVRPDLLLAGARRADVLLQQAHASACPPR
jgi:hypothetical protein